MAVGNTEDVYPFLIENPNRGGFLDFLKYMWIIMVSKTVRMILIFFGKPLELTGIVVEFILNLLSLNGGFCGLLSNIVPWNVIIPHRGTETFISTVGHSDGRIDLYRSSKRSLMDAESGNHRALMDLCMMSSKLSYENEKVIQNVVTLHWKMHFVDFYNCWNDFQERESTPVFILCDKPEDANLIIIAFRGTEPFDADDWCTDFDYLCHTIPDLGMVHTGFLEALGLGKRTHPATFVNNLVQLRETQTSIMADKSAYYMVRAKLKSLLEKHKKAKFVVTGHSLGGALAILFPTLLFYHQYLYHEETEVIQRFLGVYTFGQPRVGDSQLRSFMEDKLGHTTASYFRVVYCNDVVPRLPYDDDIFLYKHFGRCLYYDCMYNEHRLYEEPNKNFGLIQLMPARLNAVFEVVRGLFMGYIYGPDYKEGWFMVLFRVVGLALPGISAHCPTNYVNSIRLGKYTKQL